MITYNHAKYLSVALDTILTQKTDFKFEIVVGEDNCSDNTREILKLYQEKFPGRINALYRDKNLGMMGNFIDTLKNCKGKYIALCEGDDFWTDENKLQKQIDFLEKNNDFSLCFHNVRYVDDNGKNLNLYHNTETTNDIFTISDLCKGNFIATVSAIFRNIDFTIIPDWFTTLPAGDYALYWLVAKKGKIKYINEVMAAYRKHDTGIWSTVTSMKKTENTLYILNAFFENESTAELQESLKETYLKFSFHLMNQYLKLGKIEEVKRLLSSLPPNYLSTELVIQLNELYRYSYTAANDYNALQSKIKASNLYKFGRLIDMLKKPLQKKNRTANS